MAGPHASGVWTMYRQEIVVCAAFLCAGFVQGVAGFGAGMVSMAILPLAMPLMDVVPIVGVFCAATNGLILLQLRKSLDETVCRSPKTTSNSIFLRFRQSL